MKQINCPVCQYELPSIEFGGYNCPNCTVRLFYAFTYPNELLYLQIRQSPYLIELDIRSNRCLLFHMDPYTSKPILTLDYLPIINADNVYSLMDRLLKLKAFS
jgi:hypothetical protein